MDAIREGNVQFYLDALDEIRGDQNKRVEEIDEWIWKNAAQVVVTCRTRQYTGGLRLPSLNVEIHAEALNETLIRRFSMLYLQDRADSFLTTRFFLQLGIKKETDTNYFNWCKIPVCFMLLSWFSKINKTEELPRNPGLLFQRMASALLKRQHDKHPDAEKISFEAMEEAFGRLAYTMIDEDTSGIIDIKTAAKQMVHGVWWKELSPDQAKEAEAMLYLAQSANWINLYDTSLEFFHPLMQAYFAAAHLLRVSKFLQLKIPPRVVVRKWRSPVASDLVPEGKWDYAVIALSGIHHADTVVNRVMEENPHLAAQCLYPGDKVLEDTKTKLIYKLVNVLCDANEEDQYWTGAYLSESLQEYDKKSIRIIKKEMIRHVAADGLRIIGKSAVKALIGLLENPEPNIQRHATKSLIDIGLDGIGQLMAAYKDSVASDGLGDTILEIILQICIDGEPEKAEKALSSIIERSPHFSDGYWIRGRWYKQTGDLNASISDFTKAIGIKSDQVAYYRDRVSCYFSEKRTTKLYLI